MFDAIINTPFGPLGLQCSQTKTESLSAIHLIEGDVVPHANAYYAPFLKTIIKKIQSYFNKAHVIDLPLDIQGSPFQKEVWKYLCKIPVGETRTYGECAKELKTAARAVGMACRTNPLPIVIPCHRIVGAKHIGGYCGQIQGKSVSIKQWLLAHEGRT